MGATDTGLGHSLGWALWGAEKHPMGTPTSIPRHPPASPGGRIPPAEKHVPQGQGLPGTQHLATGKSAPARATVPSSGEQVGRPGMSEPLPSHADIPQHVAGTPASLEARYRNAVLSFMRSVFTHHHSNHLNMSP